MSDLVDEARNMEDNHQRTGDSYQATLYGKLATEIERLKAYADKLNEDLDKALAKLNENQRSSNK